MSAGAAAAGADDEASRGRRLPAPGAARPASPEIDYDRAFTRLCHLVPLTEGKADDALDGVVLSALASAGMPVAGLKGTLEAVEVYFGLRLDGERVQVALDRLVASSKVFRTRGELRVAGEVMAAKLEQIERSTQLEGEVRAALLATAEAQSARIDGDLLWACFRKYLALVLRTHGMLAIELLDPRIASSSLDTNVAEEALSEALTGLDSDDAGGRRAIEAFFAIPSPARVRYVAQMLDATFTLYAMSLDDVAASYLRDRLPDLVIFLDTNALFGVLELDTSPHGQAAYEMVRFVRDNKLPVTFYYHEQTLQEIERTISGVGSKLRSQRWTTALSRAAIDKRVLGELRDIERRYHELNAETTISPRDFLSKYDHIPDLLEPHGIKLFRPSGIPTYTTEQKALLVAEYIAYVQARRPNDPKPYTAVDHDVTVWLEAQGRSKPSTRPLEAGALFVTNDFFFRGFASKNGQRRRAVVVMPTQLLQVLRPFGRPTDDDDARFVAALCLPEFRMAHTGYAEAQGKVLGILAHYGDLDTETAVSLLANEVLNRRVRNMEPESEELREAIESAVMQDNVLLRREHDDVLAVLAEQRLESEEAERHQRREADEIEEALATERSRAESLQAELADAREDAGEARRLAQKASDRIDRQERNMVEKARRHSEWIARFFAATFAAAFLTGCVASIAQNGLFSAGAVSFGIGVAAVAGLMLGGWNNVTTARAWIFRGLQRRLERRYLSRAGCDPEARGLTD